MASENPPECEEQKTLSLMSVRSIKSRTETGQVICHELIFFSLFQVFLQEDKMDPLKWLMLFMCIWFKGAILSLQCIFSYNIYEM